MSDALTIPDEIAQRTARLINEAENMREQAADDLKTIYGDLREELKALGWVGQNVSKEVAALKGAIAEMRLDEEKKAKREEKGDRVDDYVSILSKGRARAPARTRENIEKFDPETGEILGSVDAKLVQTIAAGVQTETGRKALIAAVDIMIAREEAEEDPVANVGEGATSTTAAASSDPASRADDESERQHSSTVGFADDCRTGGKEQSDASAAPVGGAAAYAHGIPALSEIATNEGGASQDSVDMAQGSVPDLEPSGPDVNGQPNSPEEATKSGAETDPGETAAEGICEAVTAGETAPSFIAKAYIRRPHCLDRVGCGSYTDEHCTRCKAAMMEREMA